MIQQFSVQVSLKNPVAKYGRTFTKSKLTTAKVSGKLLEIAALKLKVLEVVKDDEFLTFLVDYDPKLQEGFVAARTA